jgi:hypothetical protein
MVPSISGMDGSPVSGSIMNWAAWDVIEVNGPADLLQRQCWIAEGLRLENL